MSNRLYDILKNCAILYITGIGTLYMTLSAIWGLPYGEEIKDTCLALSTFIGAVVLKAAMNYNKQKEEADEEAEESYDEEDEVE